MFFKQSFQLSKMTLSLNLYNFRCWEDKKITIPNIGISLISGKSARGKR
jgi:recombinational DNA repair ATPase RecF